MEDSEIFKLTSEEIYLIGFMAIALLCLFALVYYEKIGRKVAVTILFLFAIIFILLNIFTLNDSTKEVIIRSVFYNTMILIFGSLMIYLASPQSNSNNKSKNVNIKSVEIKEDGSKVYFLK